jgi:hypothetical protein
MEVAARRVEREARRKPALESVELVESVKSPAQAESAEQAAGGR